MTVTLATCVSLGGAVFLALAIYAIVKRRKLLTTQDTLPRPFEATVPAAITTNTQSMAGNPVSFPMPNVPQTSRPRNIRRYKSAIEGEASVRLVPLRGSIPTSAMITRSQSQPCGSHNPRIQPYSYNTPLASHAAPVRFPSRCRSHLHSPVSPNPQSQSGSGVLSRQPSSSLSTSAQPENADDASTSLFVPKRRCATRTLWLSRSASELYHASTSAPYHWLPEGEPLGRGSELYAGRFVRPTNHLRPFRSALPMVRLERACLDPEANLDGAVVFQHQDAGTMQELPPPYHNLGMAN